MIPVLAYHNACNNLSYIYYSLSTDPHQDHACHPHTGHSCLQVRDKSKSPQEGQGFFMDFCHHYGLQFINPANAMVYNYITYLSQRFTAAKSVRNYVSRVRCLHRQLGLTLDASKLSIVHRRSHHEDITTSSTSHHPYPAQQSLLPHLVPCHAGAIHEGLLGLRLLWHAEAEQPCTHFTPQLRLLPSLF